MATYTKRYNGSAWVEAPFKKWNGSAWVDAIVNKWGGSSWIQLYPETAVSKTETITGSSTTWTYRKGTYNTWKQEDAKQGNGSSYGGDTHNFGYLNLSASKFSGYKNVNSLSSAKYTGTRGGAGTYNQDQTIKFYRSNVTASSSASSPSGTCSGLFTCSTGGPGSGATMSNRTISSLDNCLSWMNAVDNKPQLYISSSTASDYLSITGASKVTATYTYLAKMATFTEADARMVTNAQMLTNLSQRDIYHTMVLYPGEENMTLNEIMRHREENNLDDITSNDIVQGYEKNIIIRNTEIVDDCIEVELDYLTDGHIPECSIDGINYVQMTSPRVDIYSAKLDPEFNKNKHSVFIRVRNEITDSIDFEYEREPLFLIP